MNAWEIVTLVASTYCAIGVIIDAYIGYPFDRRFAKVFLWPIVLYFSIKDR